MKWIDNNYKHNSWQLNGHYSLSFHQQLYGEGGSTQKGDKGKKGSACGHKKKESDHETMWGMKEREAVWEYVQRRGEKKHENVDHNRS